MTRTALLLLAAAALPACKDPDTRRTPAEAPGASRDEEPAPARRDGGARGGDPAAAPAPAPASPRPPLDDAERAALRGTIHAAAGREDGFRVIAIAPATGASTTVTPRGHAWFPAPGPHPLAIAVRADDGHGHAPAGGEQLGWLGATPKQTRRFGPVSARIRSPSATPDGKTVVVEADLQSVRDLYRIDVATGAHRRLTDNREGNFEPAVSPDGTRVAFTSSRDGDNELYVMPLAGGAATRVTFFHRDDWAPAWSPDGAWLAFLSDREGEPRLYVVRPDGADLRAVPADAPPGEVKDHAWSPDGARLAYVVATRDGASEVWVAELATGEARRVSAAGARDEVPSWSPDGRHLVVVSTRDRRIDLWLVRADGTAESRLTDTPEEEWIPRWRP